MVLPVDRPWRIRRLLYAGAGALVLFAMTSGLSPRALILLGLAVGGLLTAWRDHGQDMSDVRLLTMGLYDLGVALALAALGFQYVSVLVFVGAVAALSLLLPSWTKGLAFLVALFAAAQALFAIQLGGVTSILPATLGPAAFRLFLPMLTFAITAAGLALLFGSIGVRLQQLAAAQDQLRASLDALTAPTLVVDGDEILYANPSAIVLTGQSLSGESVSETFGLGDVRPGRRGVRSALGGSGQARVSFDVHVQPITFEGRSLAQITLLDVADGVFAEGPASIGRNLDLLFDRIPAALYRSTPSGEVTAANPALAEMLGLADPNELIGAVERAQLHYRDSAGRADWIAMFEDSDVVIDYEMDLTKADGTLITVTDSARAVRDQSGSILFFEGVLMDVTKQREAEEARSRTSEILEATSDLVWLTDDADQITRMNASMRSFLGGDGADAVGMHVGRFIADEHDAAELKAWRSQPKGDPVWRGEIGLKSVDGREILTSAVAQRHRHFISLVARDITEERRTASQLERLVKSKDEFIASVSHELRTPLTAVVGLASELNSFYDELEDATKRDFIELVADQASEVAAIVEDLLVAARADTDSITLIHEHVDLVSAAEMVLAALPESKSGMFHVSGEGIACGDAQRVRQIVRNLITNAIRYGELPATVQVRAEGDTVTVAVSDKGDGIDPDMIERIFQPYERAHATVTQPNSVGLGLSVSRWLAEKMGGALVYENDTMSTFTLHLPSARCS